MRLSLVRFLNGSSRLAAGIVILQLSLGGRLAAQLSGRPSQAVANAMLSDPANLAQVRQQLENSGMTPDQIRARLRAEGYSETTLDGFLPGTRDTSAALTPDVFSAVRALGIMDSTSIATMRTSRRGALPDAPAVSQAPLADPSFRVFGHDVFARSTTQFDASSSGPVDDNYVLGPGDQLVVVLTGDVAKSYPVTVTRDGWIVIPDVAAPINVSGLTKRAVETQLFALLAHAYSGLKPDNKGTTKLLFTVARTGVIQVRVQGDVSLPGQYTVPNSSTIIAALYQAGGPTDEGSMRAVQLKRGSQTIGTFDLYNFLTTGDASSDVRVQSGDVIFIPSRGPRVRIAGQVVRPMTYEIKPGETLRDIVRLAGGFTATADRRRVQIERILPPAQRTEPGRDRRIIDITDPALATGFGPATALEPGDVIRVDGIDPRVDGQVSVKGNVWSAGVVAFAPGMHLSQALHQAGGPKPDTYLGQVNISRLEPDSTRVLVRASLRDTLGTPTNDLLLLEGDEIELFSETSFRPARYVAITGAVQRSGQYPYRDGMTLRDLALEAGGLLEGALLTKAEVARMPADRTHGTLATTLLVPLDSAYLFDRGVDGRYLGPPGVPGPARSPEVVLQPYDNVLILRQTDWTFQQTVAVEGEVALPGAYTLKSKNERIRDIIMRAGGLKEGAYPNGIVLVRRMGNVGRIGVDLPAVLRDSTNIDNLLLVGGDSIFIPTYSGVVTVHGEVYSNPLSVAYVPGADLAYYVRAAGGATIKADEGRSYVTQPNGKVESTHRHVFWTATPVPEPGSIIVVPPKDSDKKIEWGAIATATLSTVGSLVAIVALLKR